MSKENLEIYKCSVCGNIVQVLIAGGGELVCCNKPMEFQKIQHEKNELGEKHAPVREFKDGKQFIQIKAHPMLKEHYIQFMEVFNKDKSKMYIKYFKPESIPEFDVSSFDKDFDAIEFCNIHGLWGENKND